MLRNINLWLYKTRTILQRSCLSVFRELGSVSSEPDAAGATDSSGREDEGKASGRRQRRPPASLLGSRSRSLHVGRLKCDKTNHEPMFEHVFRVTKLTSHATQFPLPRELISPNMLNSVSCYVILWFHPGSKP